MDKWCGNVNEFSFDLFDARICFHFLYKEIKLEMYVKESKMFEIFELSKM